MKIYVITKGEHSDYHICAATTDKDRAEFLRDMASTSGRYGEEARIEEFDDYADLKPMKGDLYEVVVRFDRYGTQTRYYTTTENFVDGMEVPDTLRHEAENFHGRIESGEAEFGGTWYSALVVAESREKAEKIGIDMIYKHMAEKIEV